MRRGIISSSERALGRGKAAPSLRIFACLWGCTAAACGTSEPLPEAETLEYRACSADADCVYVLNGCCECAEGGEYIGVHKDQAEAFRDQFSCIFAECPEPSAEPPCGSVEAACRDELCVHSTLAPPP